MSDEEIAGSGENEEEEVGLDEGGSAAKRGFDTVALRELRRARRLIRDADEGGPIAPEAQLAIGIANVLATLELATAIRERGG